MDAILKCHVSLTLHSKELTHFVIPLGRAAIVSGYRQPRNYGIPIDSESSLYPFHVCRSGNLIGYFFKLNPYVNYNLSQQL
ncbi:hypothetical protein TNCV_5100301 [Trichonephila clavipes]|uniref:Uncharacterized protein n=1 Tax=Trichonephila clavipes TaxID=2585209 RepID=A0A8X6VC86_TRICX|nr:hypothetical protein TNCV_5100301 [Trichonephila clavipes]